MKNSKINLPKSVFINLLGIIAFYASAVSFILLLFQYINVLFPNELYFFYEGALSQIRVSMSILIVSFPIYITMTFMLNKEIFKNTNERDFKLRKWLIYFTLFISAITLIGNLITVIFQFLDGETSIRFYLKTIVIFIVAGTIFWYYIFNLKREIKNNSDILNKLLVYISSFIIIASIISGFFIIGSPAHQRSIKFDNERTQNLQLIQNEIINYWINKNTLPENLNNLENNILGFIPPTDPKTQKSYEYNILSDLSFELCATFETSNINIKNNIDSIPRYNRLENWEHNQGKTCFKRDIDPDMYMYNTHKPLMLID